MTIYSLDLLQPDLEPICCSMSSYDCCFLTCIQIYQQAGQLFWYSHLFKNFPQFVVTHTVKVFGIVSKLAEVDVFLELSCFFNDPADVGNLISGSSAFSKSSLNIQKFTVHVLLKPGLENTGVGCYFLLQGIFLTQGSNPYLLHLLHCQVDSLPLHHPVMGKPHHASLCIFSINNTMINDDANIQFQVKFSRASPVA